jgi:hypothetical protein
MHRAIEELSRETPRYSQTVIDFQNEAADATQEIADNFLDSQKEVINSLQSAWGPMAERMVGSQPVPMMRMPFFYLLSPRQMAGIYTRTIGAMTEAYVASTRMANNLAFAGLEAARATTNYARQNAKEAARITSSTARTFTHTTRETVQVEGERGVGAGTTTTTTTTAYTGEGTAASGSGTGTTTTMTGTTSLSDTTSGVTDKTRKK